MPTEQSFLMTPSLDPAEFDEYENSYDSAPETRPVPDRRRQGVLC